MIKTVVVVYSSANIICIPIFVSIDKCFMLFSSEVATVASHVYSSKGPSVVYSSVTRRQRCIHSVCTG